MERTRRARMKGRTSWWYGNRTIDPANGEEEIPYHLDNISQVQYISRTSPLH